MQLSCRAPFAVSRGLASVVAGRKPSRARLHGLTRASSASAGSLEGLGPAAGQDIDGLRQELRQKVVAQRSRVCLLLDEAIEEQPDFPLLLTNPLAQLREPQMWLAGCLAGCLAAGKGYAAGPFLAPLTLALRHVRGWGALLALGQAVRGRLAP